MAAAGVEEASPVIGTWKPIPNDDPHVIELAEYAVRQQGKQLILNSVQDGQIVEVFFDRSHYYNLLILARPLNGFQTFYNAVVLENASKDEKKVVSFVRLL